MEGVIGREIAGYRIESEIGRGGMGVVYLATQAYPERRVALKLLSSDLAADPAFRERFVRESNAAASTEHPSIVPVYGAGEADGQLYLAMRYVEGTDLRTLLDRDGTLSPDRAARICAEIAEALEAAHERGLVHRDVKPGNILLDARERAYLSDFGLIRRTRIDTGITKTGQFMGTVDYVAPEQIKGVDLDGRADVYSLGCVLYECLTGAPPFRRDADVATIYAHLERDAPAPSSKRPDLPRSMDSVVARSTAKRPDDRFATAREMADALRGGLLPEGAWKRRVRSQIAVATLALVVIASVIGFLVLRDDGAPAAPPTQTTVAEPIPLNSLVQLDAETGEILATGTAILPSSELGELPRIEVGEGGVWIAATGLTRVDPDTISLVARIDVLGVQGSIAVGFRTVWVAGSTGVVRIDPIDSQRLRPVTLFAPGTAFAYVALGESSAWAVVSDGQLTRLEAATGEKNGTVDVDQTATGMDVGLGGVWVVDNLHSTLVRIDPVTLEVDPPIPVAGAIDDISVGAGGVWLLDTSAGVVTRYDPDDGSFDPPIRVGVEPTDLTTGLDAVWIANGEEGTISKIDAFTGFVDHTIQIGSPVAAIAVDESGQALWIAVASPQG